MSDVLPRLKPQWRKLLQNEFSKPYMNQLRSFLTQEKQKGHEFAPPSPQVFRVFSEVDYHNIRVVILGQDPYHGKNQANGFAFAVPNGIAPPPSLQNIFKEITANTGQKKMKVPSDLKLWAEQGVFLLNTVLTVRLHNAFSHRGKGWEAFTDRVISLLNQRTLPIVFLLWGSAAQKKSTLITNPAHKILKAPHPSPLSAHRGFLGCGHFSQTNEFLESIGQTKIEWMSHDAQ